MSAPRCSKCRFYDFLSGACRRKAPHAFLVPGPNGQPMFLGGWPPARAEHWCGEFEPRIALAGEDA